LPPIVAYTFQCIPLGRRAFSHLFQCVFISCIQSVMLSFCIKEASIHPARYARPAHSGTFMPFAPVTDEALVLVRTWRMIRFVPRAFWGVRSFLLKIHLTFSRWRMRSVRLPRILEC